MPRYIALLRGVSPANCKMPELKRAFEAAGFADVKTVLASGNVAFDARAADEAALVRRIEAAMSEHLGRGFPVIVRTAVHLREFIAADPYAAFPAVANAKRVVTFLREALHASLVLPEHAEGVRVLAVRGREVCSDYTPHPDGPVFMTRIEQTFGKQVTTRTWDTVRKCAAA